jgi:carbonic anhydrase
MSATNQLLEANSTYAAGFDQNVSQSIGRLQANPYLVEKNRIRGFVYDVKTGALTEVV